MNAPSPDAAARLHARLDELAGLAVGWYWGAGVPSLPDCTKAARSLADRRPDIAPALSAFPGEDGSVMLGVAYDGFDLDVYFEADGSASVFGRTPAGDDTWTPEAFSSHADAIDALATTLPEPRA